MRHAAAPIPQGRAVAAVAWDRSPPSWWAQAMRGSCGGSALPALPLILATGAGEVLLGAAAEAPAGEWWTAHAAGVPLLRAAGKTQDEGGEEDGTRAGKWRRIGESQAAATATAAASFVVPLSSAQLPGQVFNAPAAFGGCVLLGCRDDFLHCLVLQQP